MSDFDSEEYLSSEDEDYMPSDEDDSDDDGKDDDAEEEEGEGGEEEEKAQKKKGKRSSKGIPSRKRKKGQLSLEGKAASKKEEAQSTGGSDEASVQVEIPKNEEDEKKKADALWASFLSDVGSKTSPPALATTLNEERSQAEAKLGSPQQEKIKKQTEDQPHRPEKVTITRVFDFAGEEVRVTKEVDSSSKDAKEFFKHKDLLQNSQTGLQPAAAASTGNETASSPVSGVKRAPGLGNILGKLGGKKQKLSTLEKSKLDWEAFKEQEGIGEELAIFNRGKDGYIERKAFLERVDQREFEHERNVRLSNMKR